MTQGILRGDGQPGEPASWWPTADLSVSPSDVVVVTVNYNTRRLVSMLLWLAIALAAYGLYKVLV